MLSVPARRVGWVCGLMLAGSVAGRAAPSPDRAVAIHAAIDSTAASICAATSDQARVQSRIALLRNRLEALGETSVPLLSAAGLWSDVPPQQRRAPECSSAVARVLRARLVMGGSPPILPPADLQPLPHHHSAHKAAQATSEQDMEARPPPPPPPQAAPPPPPPPQAAPPPAPVGSAAPAPPPAPVPPQAAAAPAPNPETMAIGALDAEIQALPKGNVAFKAPDVAKLGVGARAEALLSMVKTEAQLKAELPQSGQTVSGSLGVSAKMSATLDGGAAFDVSPAGPQDHLISGQQDTEWDWTVTPKLAGEQTLKLTVDAVLTVAGQSGTVRIDTLQRTVKVSVTPLGWLERMKQMFDDVSWLWSIPPVAAGLAWLWSRLRGKTKPDQKP